MYFSRYFVYSVFDFFVFSFFISFFCFASFFFGKTCTGPLAIARWPICFVAIRGCLSSAKQSSFFISSEIRIHSTCIWPQLGNRPSIYPYCCWISFGSIYIYANYCAESCRTGWLTRQPINCSTVQVLWLRLRLWLWLWRRISGLSVSWLQSSFVPYSSWLGWEILRH